MILSKLLNFSVSWFFQMVNGDDDGICFIEVL